MTPKILAEGEISFSIEGRILRELGERLVKKPEVALLELIKNAYDADATHCAVIYDYPELVRIKDDGCGMTLDKFQTAWMRVGTSSKEAIRFSPRFGRIITGEKGIGRFAVRFLGRHLRLESVAFDPEENCKTKLVTNFNWAKFDEKEDLGKIKVHYELTVAPVDEDTGTTLDITKLRPAVGDVDWRQVRTGSMGVITPVRSLLKDVQHIHAGAGLLGEDPGFSVQLTEGEAEDDDQAIGDIAHEILESYVLRAELKYSRGRVDIAVYRNKDKKPYVRVKDRYSANLGPVYGDIRFFPRRPGTFRNIEVDGRVAYSWISRNPGVAVFDRGFRVQPYGEPQDDWLSLARDAARNRRDPRSSIAIKHFPMDQQVRSAPSENWMLRLPQSAQLIGVIQVEGSRTVDNEESGLVASADREGFVENAAFGQLRDVVRGAVELIAVADRQLQREKAREEQEEKLRKSREDTRRAIEEITVDPEIPLAQKQRIIGMLAASQERIEEQEEGTKERERQLEVMSLLGVVAGFMTHEFGTALAELRETHGDLLRLAKIQPKYKEEAKRFAEHIHNLDEFVKYSRGYIRGARGKPSKPYPVRPRLSQVKKVFGKYAEDRGVKVEIGVSGDVLAPLVPVALYNGIAQNLFTNALKAVTAVPGRARKIIAFRAWNEAKWHHLQVCDTGIGIPEPLRDRVFDPLFTTTDARDDPIGSGMGLGLALVKRGAEAFGGKAELVSPPPGFTTCVEVRLPVGETAA